MIRWILDKSKPYWANSSRAALMILSCFLLDRLKKVSFGIGHYLFL
jgi:hypothetical protein